MEICGKCGKTQCICAPELSTARIEPEWKRAIGARLDQIGKSIDLARVQGELDGIYRVRIQLTLLLGVPYKTGIVAGKMLDKIGWRHGVLRVAGENDEDFRVKIVLKAQGHLKEQGRKNDEQRSIEDGSRQSALLAG